MQTVRRLWAVCISVGIVLLSAFPSALAVDTGDWYSSLVLPSFALGEKWFTPAWALAYLIDVAALTSLFASGASGVRLYLPLSAGVLNVFWCYTFFRLNSLTASAVLLGLITVWSGACAVLNFRKSRSAAFMFCVKTLWFVYLFAVTVSVCFSS